MTAIAEINSAGDLPFKLKPEVRDPRGNTEAYAGLCGDIIASAATRFVVGVRSTSSRT